ncbi:Crp/Fnr family transcriptional regulator [Roseicella aerolata]|uniref:Crp/Fnr family transcriptional regulator n=1 Tax=Roseicella aerolata TaxID=2883479 RepID=A0A9X1LDB1_9PROT|nr:Crp/Fnr family transcriptional regulator [Roseicella aerolata]MCB4825070.1 Crp/Fnr family transcriptional regulator [Roseicella aerolata]
MTDPPRVPAATLRLDPASLQEVPFFSGVDRQALAGLLRLGHTQRLPKEGILFERGAEASSLHLLLQGRLKVVQAAPEGRQVILRFVGPHELAGVYALPGAGQRYPATVSAVVDSVLLSWDRIALGLMLERHPQLALNAMGTLGHRAQEAHDRLREASADRVERRLALTLLRLVRQAGTQEQDGAVCIGFPLTRQDLAEMAGTTLHTASRILSGWEHAGILSGGRMRVTVRDPQALARIAQG